MCFKKKGEGEREKEKCTKKKIEPTQAIVEVTQDVDYTLQCTQIKLPFRFVWFIDDVLKLSHVCYETTKPTEVINLREFLCNVLVTLCRKKGNVFF